MEIGKNVYEAFNTFELQDVSHMNVVDRHLEQSEIWDSSLYEQIFQKEESVEDILLTKVPLRIILFHSLEKCICLH